MTARPFDLVVWGATGFTGRLVAEYLARHYGVDQGVRWAMAGRSQQKLEHLRHELGALTTGTADLQLLRADSADVASLRELARAARVVCTTVAPLPPVERRWWRLASPRRRTIAT